MIKSLFTVLLTISAFSLAGCGIRPNTPATEIAQTTVNNETFVLYNTHYAILPGQTIYNIRWANNNRNFHSFSAMNDKKAIERFETQIAKGLERWANCRGAGQHCHPD